MFNCPACGPVEIAYVHGEWANPSEYLDMVFEVVRPDFNTFIADVSPRSAKKPEGRDTPRILADVENYAEEHRKFQCSKCNRIFGIPRKVSADTSAVTGGPATLSPPGGPGIPNIGQLNQAIASLTAVPTGGASFSVPTIGANQAGILAKLDVAFTETDLDEILTDVGEDPNNYSSKSDKLDAVMDRLYN